MKARQQRRILLQLGYLKNSFVELRQISKDIFSETECLDNRKEQLAIIKLTQDICEVATTIVKIDRRIIKKDTEIKWLELRRLRETMVHEHFRIDRGTVWNMVVNNSLNLENKFLKFEKYVSSQRIKRQIDNPRQIE